MSDSTGSLPVEKATVLVEALPYIQKFRGKTIVIKYGGHAMDDRGCARASAATWCCSSWSACTRSSCTAAGRRSREMLERLGVQSRFVDGMRVTDEATMRVVEMVLAGGVNQEIVSLINIVGRDGGRAVGLSGHDGAMVQARRIDELGRVGEVGRRRSAHHRAALGRRLHPGGGAHRRRRQDGRSLNVNADPFAAKLAAAMRAEKLVLLTDVPGVKGADGAMRST